MEKQDPYILLIENCLGRLTLKYGTEFKYEVTKTSLAHTFTILQGGNPIFVKEHPILEDNPDSLSHVHYQIIRDFFIGGIERILMQKDNEKRLFPKKHNDIIDNTIQTTKGKW